MLDGPRPLAGLLILFGLCGCDEGNGSGESDVSDIDPCVLSADEHGGALGDERFHFCPEQCSSAPDIWGTTLYTSDSPLCVAAIHAGVVSRASGGPVTYQLLAGLGSYEGSVRNGVTSQSWGEWPMTVAFVDGGAPPDPTGPSAGESSGGLDPDPDPECGQLGMACCDGACDADGLVPLACVDGTCAEEEVPDCDGNGDGVPTELCDEGERCVQLDTDEDGVNDDHCLTEDRRPCDGNGDGAYQAACTEDFQCVAYDAAKDGTNEDFCVGPDLTPCDGNGDGLYQQFCWPDLMCTQFEGEDDCRPW